jgi:hypothetical protein
MSKLTDAIEQSMLEANQRMRDVAAGNRPSAELVREKLIKLFEGQARSADLWIGQWERYKDVSGVRNAAMAIGKMAGIYHTMVSLGPDENIPENIIEVMTRYNDIWNNLHISREIADVIAKHG